MSLRHLMAGFTLCLTCRMLFAASQSISGVVNDKTGAPLEFVNITLFSLSDSTFAGGTVTDESGRFILPNISQPSFLCVTAMGYEETCIDNPSINIGIITLSPSMFELGEVTVKGSRPVAKLNNDGLQVVVSGTYLANAGTASDLLGKLPFVSKNGSNIEVIGKGTPIVFINGRQMRDLSELEQLASSDIKNVDVVTSPGARYDSSVNAVIRITTVSPVGEGFSLNDRTTVGYKHYCYLFEQSTINYRKNGFDIFGTLNYENYRERPRFDNNTTQYLQSAIVTQISQGEDFVKYPVYEAKIGLNYNRENQYAGFYYDFAYRPSTGHSTSVTSRLLNSIFEDELTYNGHNHKRNRQHLLSAYYSGISGKWHLTANIDAMWQINNRNTREKELSVINPETLFSTDNDIYNRLLAGNITATYPVWKGEMQFGSEVSDIRRNDIYLTDIDIIADKFTKIKETTCALFVQLSQSIGKASVSTGIRWEYTDSRFYFWNKKSDDESRQYHNIAPNASLSIPIGNIATNISYMRKTTRPAFEQLSSAIKYIDRYSYESGNPNLKPIYRDYLSLSCSWRDLVIELSYCSTINYFMWQTAPYPGHPEATLMRIENMPRYNTIEAFANYSPSLFSVWQPTFMAGIMAQDFKLTHNKTEIKLDKPMGIFRFNNAIHLPWDIWLNIDFSAQTSGNGDNFYVKSRWSSDLGLYKSFANDTWSVKMQLNDVFSTNRQRFTSYDALTILNINKLYDTRDLSLTIRYNFNTARSRYKGSGAANTEKNRF